MKIEKGITPSPRKHFGVNVSYKKRRKVNYLVEKTKGYKKRIIFCYNAGWKGDDRWGKIETKDKKKAAKVQNK